MIVINLKGGTGNQLFQYALGRHLSIKNNVPLKLDTSGLIRANAVGDIYRPFTLEDFRIHKEVATQDEIRRLKYPYGIFSKAWRFISFHASRDKNTLFNPRILSKTGDIYLDGFWQSPNYFDSIRDTLLAEFTLEKPLGSGAAKLAAMIDSSESVSLHVRRGDYAANPRVAYEFGACTSEYYTNAVTHIHTAAPVTPTFFIFSDDIPWVKQNLSLPETVVFVDEPGITDTEELMLMSRSKHNIIANSSFSWWGAWLNQHQSKIVIAPKPWFDHQPYDKDLIPPSWIRLQK
jgi:hypothetical protein